MKKQIRKSTVVTLSRETLRLLGGYGEPTTGSQGCPVGPSYTAAFNHHLKTTG